MNFYRIVVSINDINNILSLKEFTKQLGLDNPVDLGQGKFTSATDFPDPTFFKTRVPYGIHTKGYYITEDESVEYRPFGVHAHAMDV